MITPEFGDEINRICHERNYSVEGLARLMEAVNGTGNFVDLRRRHHKIHTSVTYGSAQSALIANFLLAEQHRQGVPFWDIASAIGRTTGYTTLIMRRRTLNAAQLASVAHLLGYELVLRKKS